MSDKKITIESAFNSKGLSEVSKSLKALKKDADTLSKSFENLTKTQRGTALFAKSIAQSSTNMAKLRGISVDTSKVMKDLLGKSIDTERKNLDNLNKSISKYNDLYSKRKQQYAGAMASGDTLGANKAQASMGRLQGNIASRTSQQQDTMAFLDQLEGPSAKAKLAKVAMGIIGVVAGAAGTVSLLAGTYQESKTASLVNQAAITGMTTAQASSLMGGNFQAMMALQDPRAMKAVQNAGGTGAAYTRDISSILAKVAAGAGAGALGGGVAGLIGGPLAALTATGGALIGGGAALASQSSNILGLFTGGPEQEAQATQQKALAAEVQKNGYANFLLDNIKNNGSAFVGAGRRLGGVRYANQAAGMGIGLGFGGAEAAGLAGGFAGQIGASGAQQNLTTFFQLQKGLTARTGGRNANIANLSAEGAGSLLTGLSYGQEGRAGASQSAVDFLAKAFSKGLTDARVGEDLGKVLTENLSAEGGRRSARGFLGNAFAGVAEGYQAMFGQQLDRQGVGELSRGLGAFDTAFSSKLGGAFATKNQALARGVVSGMGLGSGGNAEYLVSALSNLSLKDLSEGGNEGLQSFFGGDKGRMNKAVGQFKNKSAQSTVDLLFPSNAFGIKTAFDNAGGDISKAFASMDPNQKKQFAYALQTRAPQLGLDLRSGVMGELFYEAGGRGTLGGAKITGTKDLGASSYLGALSSVAQEEGMVRGEAFKKENVVKLNQAMHDSVNQFGALVNILKVAPDSVNNFSNALTVAQMRLEKRPQAEIDAFIKNNADAAHRPALEHRNDKINQTIDAHRHTMKY